ncbi:cysteine--tRNA ligase [Intestinibacillus massiliensis]|uniref:cysteine--tRNA ligase n=1 Tax=Intestinibacillus massiliensis TaxID=1871029 RepID=UPI000B352BAD|nr:cysteine--tRNA ligase [Intestinibacillus massiliensis]
MKLFNTLTRQKDEFVPITPGEVKMYSCGPTVYNFFHVGNARPFIVFDLLRRYFEYRGYKVEFVQNFTDIDDKVIAKANEEGVTYDVIADRYIKEYYVDAEGLGIRRATLHPRATETMDAIIGIIQKLIDKGHAYAAPNGDVYFRTKSDPEYGKLCHQPLEDLQAGARISVGEQKEDPMDFAVWKAAKPGEPSWDAPWGKGRPGWHIECSAMVNKYLGQTIDIHGGGLDLTFPHHENEIAQSECANGCTFANYWVHNGFLTIDNEKMSKSKGNFFMVREAAQAFGYETIRMFMLSAHYRTPLNYSEESLRMNKASLERLYEARNNMEFRISKAPDGGMSPEEAEKLAALGAYKQKFIDAMDDDLNTADALSAVFELTREVNGYMAAHQDATAAFLTAAHALFMELTGVLGIAQRREEAADPDAEKIEALIAQRAAAKKNKDFAEADRIRDELAGMGVTIKDTRQGTQWSRA